MQAHFTPTRLLAALTLASGLTNAAQAAMVQITVKAESLVAPDSVTFAPLHVGFHQGTFDAFNLGQAATDTIISVAERGAGNTWHTAFDAADPTATHGTVGGILTPGMTSMKTFMVDSSINPYFTFAAMVVPSNDFFIGNDKAKAYTLLDDMGHLKISSITVKAKQIWDAGSEVFDPAAAAFIAGAMGSQRAPQNSVVAFNFGELAAFNGMTTAAGYTFQSGLSAEQDVYRISFTAAAVPEPETYALLAAGLLTTLALKRRRMQAAC